MTPIDKSTKKNHCMANICTDIHPSLAEVPSELWAKHKHDLGLIKGGELVIIIPKSDYRPCQQQYPLKAESLLGITSVFKFSSAHPNLFCEKDNGQGSAYRVASRVADTVTLLKHLAQEGHKVS